MSEAPDAWSAIVLESIDHHFRVCPDIAASEVAQHKESLGCPRCVELLQSRTATHRPAAAVLVDEIGADRELGAGGGVV